MEGGSFVVYRGNDLAGEATGFSVILGKQPLGTIGISYQLLDLGDIDSRDGEGNYLGSISFRDHLAIISFGLQVLPRLDTGINFKVAGHNAGDCCRSISKRSSSRARPASA